MQQMLSLAQQIMNVLNNTNVAVEKVERQTPVIRDNLENFRQLERIALRYLALAKQMGLPEDVNRAVTSLSQLIVMIRMAQMSLNALMSSNPYTMAIGIAGLIMTATSAGNVLEGY